jgi:hypothetical protein
MVRVTSLQKSHVHTLILHMALCHSASSSSLEEKTPALRRDIDRKLKDFEAMCSGFSPRQCAALRQYEQAAWWRGRSKPKDAGVAGRSIPLGMQG